MNTLTFKILTMITKHCYINVRESLDTYTPALISSIKEHRYQILVLGVDTLFAKLYFFNTQNFET